MGARVGMGRSPYGETTLWSDGDDGSRSILRVSASGVFESYEEGEGVRIVGTLFPGHEGFDVVTIDPGPDWLAGKTVRDRDFTGPWVVGPEITRDLLDGGKLKIRREGDGTGHFWDSVVRTQGQIDKVLTPGYVSTRITHPSFDDQHPRSVGGQQTIEFGTIFSPTDHNDDEHFSETKQSGGRDALGRDTTVTSRDSWTERGERTQGVGVEAGNRGDADYAKSRTWCRETGNGEWELITLTTDRNGDGQKTVTKGHADGSEETSSSDYHENQHEEEEHHKDDDPPDKKAAGSPAGDDWGYEEGNPDGPFTGMDLVTLAHVFGPTWRGHQDYDTLGDVDRAMAPHLARLRAAAAQGVGGNKEELDRLGAPPFAGYTMFGIKEDDGVFELDTLGKPPPIHFGALEVSVTNGVSALSADQLLQVYREQPTG